MFPGYQEIAFREMPAAADALILRGMRFFARHGVFEAERNLGQRFVVDVRIGACLRAAGNSDDLDDTINYAAVHSTVQDVVERGPQRRLIEKVAHDIATRILEENPRAVDVNIAITKPHVAVPDVDALGVEIYRARIGH